MRVLPTIKNLRRVTESDRTFWAADLQVGTETVALDQRFGAWFTRDGRREPIGPVAEMLQNAVRSEERRRKPPTLQGAQA